VGGRALALLGEESFGFSATFDGDFSFSAGVAATEAEDALRSFDATGGVLDTVDEPRRSPELVEIAEPRLKDIFKTKRLLEQ
jgi:hypothetical protein